jgi:hypothetical protein
VCVGGCRTPHACRRSALRLDPNRAIRAAFEELPNPGRDQIQAAINAGDSVDAPKPLGIDIRRIEDNSSENA